jgi:hypothetical protein
VSDFPPIYRLGYANRNAQDVTTIEQIEELLGKGEVVRLTSPDDEGRRLITERYTNEYGLSARFAYTDDSLHRLVWVDWAIREVSAKPPNPSASAITAESPAPSYDPNFVFETKFIVSVTPDKYSLAMSSVPGMYLEIDGQAEGVPKLRYSCDSGVFGLLEDNIITTLGKTVERDFGSTPIVHWTPDANTKDNDSIIVRLVGGDGELAAVGLTVRTDGTWYSLEQVSTAVVPLDPVQIAEPELLLYHADPKTEPLSKVDNWYTLDDPLNIDVIVPPNTVYMYLYRAEAGTEATPHIIDDFEVNPLFPSPVLHLCWNVSEEVPDGFLGHIRAVTTDADGVEHTSEIVNVIYEPIPTGEKQTAP